MNFKHLTLALAATLCVGAVQAQSLVLSPSTKTVALGDTFSLQVQGKGFPTEVVGGGFNLSFTAGLLELTPIAIDAGWDFAPRGGLIDNASGTLTGAAFNSIGVPKAGDYAVATLNFKAIGTGVATVSLMPSITLPFTDVDVNPVEPSFGTATINIPAVPEPSSLALLLAGAGGLAWMGRRKQQG